MNVLREPLQRFKQLRFPGTCRGRNVYGIELVLLDAEIVSAVEKIVSGNRDPTILNQLGRLELYVRMVLQVLRTDESDYYEKAKDLARLALDSIPMGRNPAISLVEAVIAKDITNYSKVDLDRIVINEHAFEGDTALTAAARLGRQSWTKMLLTSGADPTIDDGTGRTPFILAIVSGQGAILRILVESDVNIMTQLWHDVPLLWWAIYEQHDDVVAILLELGADPWAKDSEGRDPYDFAIEHGLVVIAQLIAHMRR